MFKVLSAFSPACWHTLLFGIGAHGVGEDPTDQDFIHGVPGPYCLMLSLKVKKKIKCFQTLEVDLDSPALFT